MMLCIRRRGIIGFILGLVFMLSGCATIMHGDSQYVNIDTDPKDASIQIQGQGGRFTAPARILLKRGYPMQEYQILVEKEGYKPGYAKITQKLSAWLWGDIIWGIIPGIAIDMITGAAFDLKPAEITVELEESIK